MKKAIGMFAALLIALGMTGVAHACWSERLLINGTVSTGEVNVGYVDWYVSTCGSDTKEIVDVEIIPHDLDADGDYDKLELNIDYWFPCVHVDIWIIIHCGGSVPVILVDDGWVDVTGDYELIPYIDEVLGIEKSWTNPDTGAYYETPEYFFTEGQLEYCDYVIIHKHLHLIQWIDWDEDEIEDPEELCPENAAISFDYYIDFVQYNCV